MKTFKQLREEFDEAMSKLSIGDLIEEFEKMGCEVEPVEKP